jgi:hypothetical protein
LARRNNANRLGGPPPAGDTPAETKEELQSDSLSFIVPTEFVALPSKGRFYPPDHPLHNEETLEIKYMTAKEEDLLSSKSLIERGVVLDRLIQNLLVNTRLQSRDLLIADRNAILIAARSSGYGTDYTTKITCRSCGTQDSYAYDLDEALVQTPLNTEELEDLGVVETEENTFVVKIPSSPVDVEFRLLNGHDEHAMMDLSERRRKRKMPQQLVTDQLGFMIVSAMGETDPAIIQQYADSLPLRDSRFLRKTYEAVSPSIELRKEFVCNHCDCEDEVNFPFTVDFFWPDI